MTHNPILEELYAIRERLLADAGGDLHKFLAGVRDREAASGRLLVQGVEEKSEPAPSLTIVDWSPQSRTSNPCSRSPADPTRAPE